MFQFEVETEESIFLPGNFDTIATDTLGSYFGGIQSGTDGRIYVSRSPYENDSLSVIQNPKRPDSACNFTADALDLQGRNSRYGFPNFIQSYFDLPHFDVENVCFTDTTVFVLQNDSNIDSVLWMFGDGNPGSSADIRPAHIFSGPGSYQVQVTEYFNGMAYGPYVEEVIVNEKPSVDIGDTIYISPGSPVFLDAGAGYFSYEWSTGANTQTLQIIEPGIYAVTVQNDHCCYGTDSVVVRYYFSVDEGNENDKNFHTFPNPGDGNLHLVLHQGTREAKVRVFNILGQNIWGPHKYKYVEINGELIINISKMPDGIYFILVDAEGYAASKEKYILRR